MEKLPEDLLKRGREPKPIVLQADWVKYMRARFGKEPAEAIFKYLRKRKQELIDTPYAGTANYSLPRVLWDKKGDAPANPEQKMALLMYAMNKQHRKVVREVAANLASEHNLMLTEKEENFSKHLVPECFGGKSYFDPTNDLLHWVRPTETEDETDAE